MPAPTINEDVYLGTAFCLDDECRFIVTNYHVAKTVRAKKVKGDKIIQRYLATGPDDNDATVNFVNGVGVLPYSRKRDLAILELEHPLAHHHGAKIDLDLPEPGEQVDIYGYTKGALNPVRKLSVFPATFKGSTISGLLCFEYRLASDKEIRLGGASGGIVVSRRSGEIVGILSAANATTALAVPTQTLADFVGKEKPFLAAKVFPTAAPVSPLSTDLLPKFTPGRVDGLQHRPEEPPEIHLLRQKAQALADSMRDFIAVQSFAWGSDQKEVAAEAAYEVRVVGDQQQFRRYPDGKKELRRVSSPPLNSWVIPSDEWSALPKMVGSQLRLKVRESPDAIVNKQRVKVFQYYADVEDNLCPFEPVVDFGFFSVRKNLAVGCYGEVWTDEDTNIIRMSENLELSSRLSDYQGWYDYQIVLTYGWLRRADEQARRVPLTILTEARNKRHLYWCRGFFTNYREFTVHARMITP
jgi:hypothetical protein